MNRILIGGVVGGLVVFIWGAVSHMLLPLGEAGIAAMPNENAVMEAMKAAIPSSGLYFFPGEGMGRDASPEAQKAWQAKYEAGPRGLLIYHPGGEKPLSPRHLLIEFLSNVAAALVAALVLAKVAGSYGRRAGMLAVLGLFTWLNISFSYWNWYGFPSAFVIAEGIDQVAGWLLAGLAMAKIVRPARA